jgi:hypothetical protein
MFARPMLLSLLLLFGVFLESTPAFAQPNPVPAAQLGLTPSAAQLQFGLVGIHYGGTPQQRITFSNESPSAVTAMPPAISGPDASRFQITYDGCGYQTISPGSNCAVEVNFQPGELGEKNATLTLELLGEGTLEVPLSGTGSTGTLSAKSDPLSFSAIPYARSNHEESQNETEQVNIEAQSFGVQIESVSITGADASSFSVQYGDCEGDQLSADNWCDAGIRFQPTSPGQKHAQLLVKSDAQNGTLVVPLEGEGLNGPRIDLQSNEAQLGEIPLGSAASHTFTLTNGGDYPLFVQQSFMVSGTPQMFHLLSDTCSGQIVQPATSCLYTVEFQPTTPGEKDTSIIFITNASPQINVLGINGIGVAPPTAASTLSSPTIPSPAIQQTISPPARHDGVRRPTLLTFEQTPHMYSPVVYNPTGDKTIRTGVSAQCPEKISVCETESFITARVLPQTASTTSESIERKTVLLGSHTDQLHGGERAAVRVPLSSGAMALLKRHGHLRATIETIIRVDGKIIAEGSRTVKLVTGKAKLDVAKFD